MSAENEHGRTQRTTESVAPSKIENRYSGTARKGRIRIDVVVKSRRSLVSIVADPYQSSVDTKGCEARNLPHFPE